MANVTALVKSLRAEEGVEMSRLASVMAAMEKGLEALQHKSSVATVQQGGNTMPQKKLQKAIRAFRFVLSVTPTPGLIHLSHWATAAYFDYFRAFFTLNFRKWLLLFP